VAAWRVIVRNDLRDYLVAAQVTAFSTAALGSGQADPFTTVMQDRCNYIRNRISKRISLSATDYAVPPELKTTACALILEAMQTRLPFEFTDAQKRQIDRAYRDLDIAGTEDLPISIPDDPMVAPVQSSGGFQKVRGGPGRFTRQTMRGL